MRLLFIAGLVWLAAIIGTAILLEGSSRQTRAISATSGAAAGSLIVLYCIQKKRAA